MITIICNYLFVELLATCDKDNHTQHSTLMPATIVAHPDLKHDCSSFNPNFPSHYKRYETRSFTNAQATRSTSNAASSLRTPSENQYKPKLLKHGPVSPGLLLGNRTTEPRSIKTCLPVEQETQDNKSVDCEEGTSDVATTTADSLYDHDIQKSYHSEHFTPNVQNVLKYLTGLALVDTYMGFHGVKPREFEIIEHEVEETGCILTKPRLAYDYNEHLLTIHMPTVLHEAFHDDLKDSFTSAIKDLPYNRRIIRPQVYMNYKLRLKSKSVMPDMVISLTATQGPTQKLLIPYIGETALTEQWDHVFKKMESMIVAHPEIILASIVLVREAKRYTSPQQDSIATDTLHNRCNGEEKPDPLSLEEFITQRSTLQNFEEPVQVSDHTWCHVESVEYFVWIKGDKDRAIDMRNGKPEDRAYGVLLPELHMDDITKIFDRGMSQMRDLFLLFQKDLDPKSAIDHSSLANFVIPPFPIDWDLGSLGVLTAADLTAYTRYVDWHDVRFRGAKHTHDSSYEPSESEYDGSSSESGEAHSSKPSASTPNVPPHLTFRTFTVGHSNSDSTPVAHVASNSMAPTATSQPESSKVRSKSKGKGKGHRSRGPNKRART
ncbi:uncharacterized protein F5147DRAFT_655849 [Suillus discolor]|uniref:Uncharacterized protein n=1 Tax=Suillus discolor TaxID=1912936 RepID=A0A9P7F122_9AGAM|nr:uncharacterized protein F5147DRAFT_655849 [Suillus discolor]KAG2099247.1 hypothetical protein F5147DRAFT_655849 [Suillus discolor]